MSTCALLNARFGLTDQLRFVAGPGGLVVAEVGNDAGRASVALHGAHVLSFEPRGERPVLWLSRRSWFAEDKPIRGGIPVCWPWFGAHPSDPLKPSHGFARLSAWEVLETAAVSSTETLLRLGLRASEASRRFWPEDFVAEVVLRVGRALDVALVMRNTGRSPWTISAALHSYFAVSDVTRVRVLGLEGATVVDTVGTDRAPRPQRGPVTIAAETDQVFTGVSGDVLIEDDLWQRRLRIRTAGSRSAVVWNPWVAKAQRLQDFADDEYPGMLCVETATIFSDARTVPPGSEHCLQATISTEPLP